MGIHHRTGRKEEEGSACCTALATGGRVFVSGLSGSPYGSAGDQFGQAAEALGDALGRCDVKMEDVVRTRVFYTRTADRPTVCKAHGGTFGGARPATSLTQVRFLPGGAAVLIEAEAVKGSAKGRRARALDTPEGKAMGGSAVVQAGDDNWLAGVTATDPDGGVASPGDAEGQSREVVRRMTAWLSEFGVRPQDVVGTRTYGPLAYVGTDTWSERRLLMHPGHPTAADITVEAVGGRELGIMMEAEAVIGAAEKRRNVNTGRWFEEEHHYSRSVRVGEVVQIAGTTSVQVGESVEGPFDAYVQAVSTLEWIRWAVERQGLPFADLVRTRSYVVGEENVEPVTRAFREVLGEIRPVATVVGVPALGRPSILLEVEATAVLGAAG